MNRKGIVWKNESVIKLLQIHNSNDPIELIRELSRNIVLNAYNKGWSGPPFSPIEFARLLGYSIHPNDEITDARIYTENGSRYIIEYNSAQKSSRINFSIAHEIGHTIFPDCHERIRNREVVTNDEWELEFLCNVAASEILLPYAEFSEEANSINLSMDQLLSLADKYKASIESVFLRFCEVSDKPCTVTICSFNEQKDQLSVEYSKSSKNSVLFFDAGLIIPSNSKAYECINPGWTAEGLENWSIFGATRYMIYAIGLSHTKTIRKDRVGIFFVPEFYSLNPISKIYIVQGDATKPRGKGMKIIAQVVNTSGGAGFGFGRAMSKTWPESKRALQNWKKDRFRFILGKSQLTQLDSEVYVLQMLAQKGIFARNNEIPLKYDALQECLYQLKDIALKINASIHMPFIGAGQAQGNWNIIQGMIYETLVLEGLDVTVYSLPGNSNQKDKKKGNLTLFD